MQQDFGSTHRVDIEEQKTSRLYAKRYFAWVLEKELVSLYAVRNWINKKLASGDEIVSDYVTSAIPHPVRGGVDISEYDLPFLAITDKDNDNKIIKTVCRVRIVSDKQIGKLYERQHDGKCPELYGIANVNCGEFFVAFEIIKRTASGSSFYTNVIDDVYRVCKKLERVGDNIGVVLNSLGSTITYNWYLNPARYDIKIGRWVAPVKSGGGDAPQGDAPQGDAPQGDAPQGDAPQAAGRGRGRRS